MKTKKLLSILLALSLVFSLFTGMSLTASAAGYDGTYTFENFNADVYGGGKGVTSATWSVVTEDETYLKFTHDTWYDLATTPAVLSVCKNGKPAWNDSDKVGFECGKTYKVTMVYKYPVCNVSLTVSTTLLKDGNVDNYDTAYDKEFFVVESWLNNAKDNWQTATMEYEVPDSFDSASTSNFGIVLKSNWYNNNADEFCIKSVTVTPVEETVTVPEDSEGTTGYKGERYTFGGSAMVTGQSWYGYVKGSWIDNGSYVTLNGQWDKNSLGVMPVTKVHQTWNGDPNNQIGFVRGKSYEITMDYRANITSDDFGTNKDVTYTVGLAMLENGRGDSYDSDRAIPLVTIDSSTENPTDWKTYTGTFTVPEDYTADCTTSNFGIYFVCSTTKGVDFHLKSVRITESKMTTDFSNYTSLSIATDGNACLSSASSTVVTPSVVEDSENKYIKLSKTALYTGTNPYGGGFGIVVNQAAAASWGEDSTPLANSYILENGETYYITLKYKLSITDDTVDTLPVTMLHSGWKNTAAGSLSNSGITNSDNTLEATDTWRTVTFKATMNELASDNWNSFGLGFYDDAVKDINFELCLDKVVITTCKYIEGDVNDDGSVDILDLVRQKKFTADTVGAVEINETVADIDNDGSVSATDLAELRKILLGVQKKNLTDSDTAESFKNDGYSLVWNDEFDGDSIDGSLWNTRDLTSTLSNAVYTTSEVGQYVGGGNLNMSIIQYKDNSGNIKYSIPSAVTTADTMAFRYGYLEMRAKMSFKCGAWLSFWMQGLTPLAEKNDAVTVKALNGCLPEVDIFEVHNGAGSGKVTPNLHLWKYIAAQGNIAAYNQHVQAPVPSSGASTYTFSELQNLSNEYHTYGFLWTPEVMTMYVDGTAYVSYDLTKALWDGLGSTLKGEEDTSTSDLTETAFHSPMDIILGCGISTSENASWLTDADMINDSTYETLNYNVDYIRLYQNKDIQNTKLYTK